MQSHQPSSWTDQTKESRFVVAATTTDTFLNEAFDRVVVWSHSQITL